MKRSITAKEESNRLKNKCSISLQGVIFCSSLLYAIWIIYCHYVLHQGAIKTVSKGIIYESKKGWKIIESMTTNDGRKKETQKRTKKEEDNERRGSGSNSRPRRQLTLTAYIEKFQYYKSSDPPKEAINDSHSKPKAFGKFITPLPLRTGTPSDLKKVEYPKVSSCSDLPHNLPVDPGLAKDSSGKLILDVVGNQRNIFPDRLEEFLPYTPVNSDAFLPWLHDVFSAPDGSKIHFIAQNKRRCNNDKKFYPDLYNLEPQVAIMQPVPVKRVVDENDIPLSLWDDGGTSEERYELSSHEDADDDGKETRFLCRFHTPDETKVTLSQYPYNLEFVNWKKGYLSILTGCGKDNSFFWLATNEFYCPVPDVFRADVASGEAEGWLYLDLVPIRTAPRYGQNYINIDGFKENNFDPGKAWGRGHVLPKIEASGRLANLPVCRPVEPPPTISERLPQSPNKSNDPNAKPHYLIGCLWASMSYATRANEIHLSDSRSRLLEWLEFHFMVGLDHIYIYDNSAANSDAPGDDLSSFVDIFGRDKITIVPWPFRVCNNNRPKAPNMGERSSQYAAEASCRGKYGPSTEWLIGFDPDEYLIPMGNYDNLKDFLRDVDKKEDTKILNFYSTRATLRYDKTVPYYDDGKCQKGKQTPNAPNSKDYPVCVDKDPQKTYIETYNCECHPVPGQKPDWGERARKQIYKPSYVLRHFVHYSPITTSFVADSEHRRYRETHERKIDDLVEATMVHTKSQAAHTTEEWSRKCLKKAEWNEKCRLGFSWPIGKGLGGGVGENETNKTEEGWLFNCWTNERLQNYWLPKLEKAMKKRRGTRSFDDMFHS